MAHRAVSFILQDSVRFLEKMGETSTRRKNCNRLGNIIQSKTRKILKLAAWYALIFYFASAQLGEVRASFFQPHGYERLAPG
jgi:phosphoserine aminotransferase